MPILGTAEVLFKAKLKKFDQDVDRSEAKVRHFGAVSEKQAKRINKSFKLIAVAAITTVTIALAALAASSVDVGKKFEQSMATVGGVMRATSAEFDALSDKAREMGEKTEWSATQSAEALNFLGMAGFGAQDAMDALPGVLDLATAGNIDLGRSADIATNALTAMKLPVSELSRVNDVFVGTITRSNTNMDMMAESFVYAAPVAKAFGYDIENLSAMVGILGNAGVQGSMAGTQLAFAFQNVDKVFKKLGVDGTGKNFIDALELINDRGMGAQDVMELFGMRAGRAALILKDSLPQYRELTKELKNSKGEAKALADVMRNTTSGATKELSSVFESVKIDAFEKSSGDLVDTIKEMTRYFRENKEVVSEFIANIIQSGAGIVSFTTMVAEKVTPVLERLNALYRVTKELAQWAGAKSVGVDMKLGGKNDQQTILKSNIKNAQDEISKTERKIKSLQDNLAGWVSGPFKGTKRQINRARFEIGKYNRALEKLKSIELQWKKALENQKIYDMPVIGDDYEGVGASSVSVKSSFKKKAEDLTAYKDLLGELKTHYKELSGDLTPYEKELKTVNSVIDKYTEKLTAAGKTEAEIAAIRQKAGEDIKTILDTKNAEKLETAMAGINTYIEGIGKTLTPYESDLAALNREFDEQEEKISALSKSETDLTEERKRAVEALKAFYDGKEIDEFKEKTEKALAEINEAFSGAFADTFVTSMTEGFEEGFSKVGDMMKEILKDTLQKEIQDGIGVAISNSLSQMGGMAGNLAGPLGGIFGTLAGGIVGSIGKDLFGFGSDNSEKRARERALVNSLEELTKTIKENTIELARQLSPDYETSQWSETSWKAMNDFRKWFNDNPYPKGSGSDSDLSNAYYKALFTEFDYLDKTTEVFYKQLDNAHQEFLDEYMESEKTAYEQRIENVSKDATELAKGFVDIFSNSSLMAFFNTDDMPDSERERHWGMQNSDIIELFKDSFLSKNPNVDGDDTLVNYVMPHFAFQEAEKLNNILSDDDLNAWQKLDQIMASNFISAEQLAEALGIQGDAWDGLLAVIKDFEAQRAEIHKDVDYYIRDLSGNVGNLEKVMAGVDSQFDTWEASIYDLGGAEHALAKERELAKEAARAKYVNELFQPLDESIQSWKTGLVQQSWGATDWKKEFDRLGGELFTLNTAADDYYETALDVSTQQFNALKTMISIAEQQLDAYKNTQDSISDQIWDLTSGNASSTTSVDAWMKRYNELFSEATRQHADGGYDVAAIKTFQSFIPDWMKTLGTAGFDQAFLDRKAINALTEISSNLAAPITKLSDLVTDPDYTAPQYVRDGSLSFGGGITAEEIGNAVSDAIAPVLVNDSGGKEIHVHVHINENEIGYAVVNQLDTNDELITQTRKVANG